MQALAAPVQQEALAAIFTDVERRAKSKVAQALGVQGYNFKGCEAPTSFNFA
jgi:hypothetical protein